jgi:hypothetical protein
MGTSYATVLMSLNNLNGVHLEASERCTAIDTGALTSAIRELRDMICDYLCFIGSRT